MYLLLLYVWILEHHRIHLFGRVLPALHQCGDSFLTNPCYKCGAADTIEILNLLKTVILSAFRAFQFQRWFFMRFHDRFLESICRLAVEPYFKTCFGNAPPVGHALNNETVSVFFTVENPVDLFSWNTEQFCHFWDGDGLCFNLPVTLSISRSAVAVL